MSWKTEGLFGEIAHSMAVYDVYRPWQKYWAWKFVPRRLRPWLSNLILSRSQIRSKIHG